MYILRCIRDYDWGIIPENKRRKFDGESFIWCVYENSNDDLDEYVAFFTKEEYAERFVKTYMETQT